MSFLMFKPVRVAAIAGSALVLLAAGNAPDSDLAFLSHIPAAGLTDSADSADMAPAVIEETPELADPAIGPILPEARSLRTLVNEIVADGQLADGDFSRGAELFCLATAIYFESKGEPLDGQLAVAQVILNRVDSGRFGPDSCSVVKARGQFGFVRNGTLPNARVGHQWDTARAIAWIALSDGWKDIVPNATHFHATRVNPGWNNLRRLATIGNHVFYR